MVSFADRLVAHLLGPGNLGEFLESHDFAGFLTEDFRRRFDSGAARVVGVEVGEATIVEVERPVWRRPRIVGRTDRQSVRTIVDLPVHGLERAVWVDAVIELRTRWTVAQTPGTVQVTAEDQVGTRPPRALVSVLRIDPASRPLDRDGTPLAGISVDGLRTDPPENAPLRLDPAAALLLRPDGTVRAQVLLDCFPRPDGTGLGLPLGADGQPLPGLRMDGRGGFTDPAGAPAATDPTTGLPLDAVGAPARPARPAIPEDDGADHGLGFTLPVRTDPLVLDLPTRLMLFAGSESAVLTDLREVVTARHALEETSDCLTSLDDITGRIPYAYVLVYDDGVLDGLDPEDVRRVGVRAGVLVHFFAIP